jgi:hypothetical protein
MYGLRSGENDKGVLSTTGRKCLVAFFLKKRLSQRRKRSWLCPKVYQPAPGPLAPASGLTESAESGPPQLQLFNFQWLARPAARSLFLLFTYSSRRRLFKDQSFFEQ